MKGIILAGGTGSRLYPLTTSTCKQLLPVYDKPMIYYPLSILMLAGVRDILIISTPDALPDFQELLGDGSSLGINLTYAPQPKPEGIAQALIIGERHIAGEECALILGDNIFYGAGLHRILRSARNELRGCTLFGYPVTDPERYAVGALGEDGLLESLEEKPTHPLSNNAITGLYFYDENVAEVAHQVRPSARGELEITDVNRVYMENKAAQLVNLGRGFAWLDAGTHDSLLEASQFMRTLGDRQSVRVACLEEVALRMGFIDRNKCYELGLKMFNSSYGQYVIDIARYWDETAER